MPTYKATSSYVSPHADPVELDPLMEHALTQTLERDVLVPVFQNLAGGLGVFVVIVAIQLWRIDYGYSAVTLSDVILGATYCGMGAFGLACAVRAFRDEWQMFVYHRSRGWAEGRTNKDLDFLEDECQRLRLENRQLSIANAQMAGRRAPLLPDEPSHDRPRQIQDEYTKPLRDALALCRFHDSHGTIARDKVVAAGQLSRPDWEAAKSLLVDAGVPINLGVFGVPVVVAMGYVREFVEKQRRAPAGFVVPHES